MSIQKVTRYVSNDDSEFFSVKEAAEDNLKEALVTLNNLDNMSPTLSNDVREIGSIIIRNLPKIKKILDTYEKELKIKE